MCFMNFEGLAPHGGPVTEGLRVYKPDLWGSAVARSTAEC